MSYSLFCAKAPLVSHCFAFDACFIVQVRFGFLVKTAFTGSNKIPCQLGSVMFLVFHFVEDRSCRSKFPPRRSFPDLFLPSRLSCLLPIARPFVLRPENRCNTRISCTIFTLLTSKKNKKINILMASFPQQWPVVFSTTLFATAPFQGLRKPDPSWHHSHPQNVVDTFPHRHLSGIFRLLDNTYSLRARLPSDSCLLTQPCVFFLTSIPKYSTWSVKPSLSASHKLRFFYSRN